MKEFGKLKEIKNKSYIEGRLGEWANFPLYSTEMLVPPLMFFIRWYYILPVIYLLNVLWGFFSDKFLNLKIAHFVYIVNRFRWIVFVVCGVFYISKGMYVESLLSFIYPFITVIFAFFNFKNNYRKIVQNFENFTYNVK